MLVPNLRGAERAMESRADELNLVMSTSETHNLANLRMPREELRGAVGSDPRGGRPHAHQRVAVHLLRLPMEGDVPQAEVLAFAQRFADLGVRGLTICDTTGMANPAQVARMCEALQQRFAGLQLTLHFHNTRGMGLANVLAAARGGITRFDGSLGGLGGCPMRPAPAATSAARTRSTCWAMGYDTGIDLPRLLQVARALRASSATRCEARSPRPAPQQLHPAPASVAELRAAFS